MEVVILGSVVSNIAIFLIERYAKRPPKPAIVLQVQTRSTETHASRGDQPPERENANTPDQESSETSETEELPEGSIPALEKKLQGLRADAKRANSPDTFVQYARLSREANKVEKELMEKKALEPNSADPVGIADLTGILSNLVTPHATRSVKRTARVLALKTAVRVLLFVLMWVYFSRYRAGESRGEVMAVDCRAFRPLSFLFRKRTPICIEDDWVCAAQPPQCVVSYAMALILTNAVFSMLLQALN